MLTKLFTRHPETVGETYFEHMRQAFSFGTEMLVGSIACLLHGFFPFLFEKTGSKAISRLHDRMVLNRDRRLPRRELPENAMAE